MVAPAEHDEVRERRRPALGPVANVMTLTEAPVTARKATSVVAMLERAAQRGWNRARPRGDFDHAAVPSVLHHHAAGVAGQAPGRSRGNVLAALEHGLSGRLRVGQRRRVDVDHHLVALTRHAGVDAVVQGRLREQSQRVGLLLLQHRRFRGDVSGVGERPVSPLIQRLARRAQRPE